MTGPQREAVAAPPLPPAVLEGHALSPNGAAADASCLALLPFFYCWLQGLQYAVGMALLTLNSHRNDFRKLQVRGCGPLWRGHELIARASCACAL